jgi:hypothetical protein
MKRGRKPKPCPDANELRRIIEGGDSLGMASRRFVICIKTIKRWMAEHGIVKPEKPVEIIEGEVWLPVPRWEGLYEVSDYGRVRSLPRDGWPGGMVKPYLNRKSHPRLMVALVNGRRENGGREEYPTVHRIVLEAFVGPRPDGMEACHNNGNACDNRLTNLRWDTKLSNAADRRKHEAERRISP